MSPPTTSGTTVHHVGTECIPKSLGSVVNTKFWATATNFR